MCGRGCPRNSKDRELNTSVPTKLQAGKNPTAERLLVAASELMIERASIDVSLSDIAQKSGVNAALVKYHFGNKDGLLLALLARDGIAPAVVFQLLLYPAVDMNMDAPSFARIPDDYPLSPSVARWFRDHYMSDTKQHTDWRASPLHAESHHGVAPAFVLTARHDPLCDEGAAYAKKLEDAGVRVWQLDMNDQLHGFLTWGKMVRAADAALEMAAATLRYAFSTAK